MTLAVWIAIAAGFGGICRHLADQTLTAIFARQGLAVAVINIVGSAILGLALAATHHSSLPANAATVIAVGWCGGFTTFSSAMTDVVTLWDKGDKLAAIQLALIPLCAATLGFFGAYSVAAWSWH